MNPIEVKKAGRWGVTISGCHCASLPSLAEFPEEKEDKELNLKQEREKKQVSKKQFFHVKDGVSKKNG